MKRAVIGLGANLGDREASLAEAVKALSRLPGTSLEQASSIYETVPVDVPDQQGDYLNQAVLLQTELSPHTLLGACLGIEAAMGRRRVIRHGARVIDLDLLVYEDVSLQTPELTLPHPELKNREFVLIPMYEIFQTGNALGVDLIAPLKAVEKGGLKPFQKKSKVF